MPAQPVLTEQNNLDKKLQVVAESALSGREGAIVVLDAQTGHVRAVVNPQFAFGNAFPPGSVIKPFMTLAALRSGVITPKTRLRCRGKYKREDVVDACSHPAQLAPFNPAEALAYSCNYYFATVGERLKEDRVAGILSDFGFGQKTGIDIDAEAPGVLARGRWKPESAVGEGAFLQVTPIQLATAYAALFNGGKLLKPATDPRETVLRSQLNVDDSERSVLLEGMRGAVTFGTAEKADLDSLPVYVVGKTGTSTQLQGFRTQGWFVGLALNGNATDQAQLTVVVYLKNAHGAEAAEVARPIFEEFTRGTNQDTTYVSVHQVSENSTRSMPLEDYVQQVVAAEASIEDQPEAIKALAITVRTYALKNLGRHKDEGYDFCSTTHCQRFETITNRPAFAAAVKDTAGLVLNDEHGEIVDAYFSASCGGMTANVKTLWGEESAPYLRGVKDDYCNSSTHARWTDVVTSEQLAKAMRSDPRTDVGQTIKSLSLMKTDQTGRAELISINGDRSRTINGWDFKLIVGRALGWNVLKSSRFRVYRSGSQFVFRGSGFGHGLGLCQEGSHVMAQRGNSYQQILAHYFPGTSAGYAHPETRRRGDKGDSAASALRFVTTSHFRLVYPQTLEATEAERVLSILETTRTELLRRVSMAGVESRFPNLKVVLNETTGDFAGRTGMPPWAAAATKDNTIELQPVKVLAQRRILETTLRHELVHVLIDAIGRGQTPRWLTEGMAIYVSGEGRSFEQQQSSMPVEEIDRALSSARSSEEMRAAYAAAFNVVRKLIRAEGENNIWKRLADRRYSVKSETKPAFST